MRSVEFADFGGDSRGSWGSFLAGACVGAAGMYLLDPNRGARRRAVMRDKLTRAAHTTVDGLDAAGRDLAHRSAGVWAGARRWVASEEVPDYILVERVRATLGRHVSHPHAIEVDANDGCVTLRGKILRREAGPLLRAVSRVAGVAEIDDRLEQHDRAGNIPSLQGGSPRPGNQFELRQEHWAPATRTLVGSAGAALVAYCAARRDVFGALFGLAGVALVLRAAANVDAARLVGAGAGRRAVDVQKTIHINAPVSTVFDFWSTFENFPRFMTHVRDVRPMSAEGHSHWTVAGPGGMSVEFDAVITRLVPNELIAWKTVDGASVAHAGIVRFEADAVFGTRVQIRLSYSPPAGAVGHAVAALLGADAKSMMDDDLARMKTLIETGNPPRDAARPIMKQPETPM